MFTPVLSENLYGAILSKRYIVVRNLRPWGFLRVGWLRSGRLRVRFLLRVQHLHFVGDNLKRCALLTFLVLPFAGLDFAFDENERAFL